MTGLPGGVIYICVYHTKHLYVRGICCMFREVLGACTSYRRGYVTRTNVEHAHKDQTAFQGNSFEAPSFDP